MASASQPAEILHQYFKLYPRRTPSESFHVSRVCKSLFAVDDPIRATDLTQSQLITHRHTFATVSSRSSVVWRIFLYRRQSTPALSLAPASTHNQHSLTLHIIWGGGKLLWMDGKVAAKNIFLQSLTA